MPPQKLIKHKNKTYAVFGVDYDGHSLPVVVDHEDYKLIAKMGKSWHCNHSGSIYCFHSFNGKTKEVFLHDIIMNVKEGSPKKAKEPYPIIHINRINLDNRRDNLIYDSPDKPINKNMKKKKRTIKLPKECGINPNDIPTYIWYMKPDKDHGERFMVSIGDITWKTTSIKTVPLKDKLEQAKTYFKCLKKTHPQLFEDYSMNGDLNKDGKELYDDYYKIIYDADYKHVEKHIMNNTQKLLT